MSVQRTFLFYLSIVISIFCLIGCDNDTETKKRQEIIYNYEKQQENARREKLTELSSKLSESFLLGSILYVCIGLMGPSVLDGTRKHITNKFKLSKHNQILLAKWLYFLTVIVITLMLFFNTHLQTVKLSVFLLLVASAYPFFSHILPSIETEDKVRMKSALGQIKSFFMLIFIFYIILRVLSPEGFGPLSFK